MTGSMRSRGVSSYRSNKRSKRGNKLSKRLSYKRSNKRSNRLLNRKSFKKVSKRTRNNRKSFRRRGGAPGALRQSARDERTGEYITGENISKLEARAVDDAERLLQDKTRVKCTDYTTKTGTWPFYTEVQKFELEVTVNGSPTKTIYRTWDEILKFINGLENKWNIMAGEDTKKFIDSYRRKIKRAYNTSNFYNIIKGASSSPARRMEIINRYFRIMSGVNIAVGEDSRSRMFNNSVLQLNLLDYSKNTIFRDHFNKFFGWA